MLSAAIRSGLAVAALVLSGAVAGCLGDGEEADESVDQERTAAPVGFAALEQRPLDLPSVQVLTSATLAGRGSSARRTIAGPGSPPEPGAIVLPAIGEAPLVRTRGKRRLERGPVYAALLRAAPRIVFLSEERTVRGASSWAVATLWVSRPSYDGPVLVRGGRLDRPGTIGFGSGAQPRHELRLPSAPWPSRRAETPPSWRCQDPDPDPGSGLLRVPGGRSGIQLRAALRRVAEPLEQLDLFPPCRRVSSCVASIYPAIFSPPNSFSTSLSRPRDTAEAMSRRTWRSSDRRGGIRSGDRRAPAAGRQDLHRGATAGSSTRNWASRARPRPSKPPGCRSRRCRRRTLQWPSPSAAFARRDLDAAAGLLHPEVEIRPAIVGGPEGTVYRGLNGNRQFWSDIDAAWATFRIEPQEFRDLGERVWCSGERLPLLREVA